MENQHAVHVFATWKVKDGQLEQVLQLLTAVHAESIKEEGNLFYKVHQDNADANTILLFEGYTSEDAVAEHRNSPHFQELVLGQIVPILEQRTIMLTTPLSL